MPRPAEAAVSAEENPGSRENGTSNADILSFYLHPIYSIFAQIALRFSISEGNLFNGNRRGFARYRTSCSRASNRYGERREESRTRHAGVRAQRKTAGPRRHVVASPRFSIGWRPVQPSNSDRADRLAQCQARTSPGTVITQGLPHHTGSCRPISPVG